MKLLEYIWEKIQDIDIDRDFLDMIPKYKQQKQK
jgi:hypothetical protein